MGLEENPMTVLRQSCLCRRASDRIAVCRGRVGAVRLPSCGERPALSLPQHPSLAGQLARRNRERPFERHGRAAAQCALNAHRPSVGLGESFGDRQAEPTAARRAVPAAVATVEPLERVRQVLGANALAGIGDSDGAPRRPSSAGVGQFRRAPRVPRPKRRTWRTSPPAGRAGQWHPSWSCARSGRRP